MFFFKTYSIVLNIKYERRQKVMETVFKNEVLKEAKSYMLLGKLLVMGPVRPFLSKLHMENSDRKLFVSLSRSSMLR